MAHTREHRRGEKRSRLWGKFSADTLSLWSLWTFNWSYPVSKKEAEESGLSRTYKLGESQHILTYIVVKAPKEYMENCLKKGSLCCFPHLPLSKSCLEILSFSICASHESLEYTISCQLLRDGSFDPFFRPSSLPPLFFLLFLNLCRVFVCWYQ